MVNEQDEDGNTPLHYAAWGNNYYSAKVLLAYGADINITNTEQVTALDYAIQENHKDIISLLNTVAGVQKILSLEEVDISILYSKDNFIECLLETYLPHKLNAMTSQELSSLYKSYDVTIEDNIIDRSCAYHKYRDILINHYKLDAEFISHLFEQHSSKQSNLGLIMLCLEEINKNPEVSIEKASEFSANTLKNAIELCAPWDKALAELKSYDIKHITAEELQKTPLLCSVLLEELKMHRTTEVTIQIEKIAVAFNKIIDTTQNINPIPLNQIIYEEDKGKEDKEETNNLVDQDIREINLFAPNASIEETPDLNLSGESTNHYFFF